MQGNQTFENILGFMQLFGILSELDKDIISTCRAGMKRDLSYQEANQKIWINVFKYPWILQRTFSQYINGMPCMNTYMWMYVLRDILEGQANQLYQYKLSI